jgi:SAM-dependent methyltransferase
MRFVSFIRGLIVLHRAYRHSPLCTRLHVLIRFLTCPFLRVLPRVPEGARLLDIGAGHGVFSVLAAEGGAHPTAVDPDPRKVRRLANVQTVIGYDDCIRGKFDVVAIVDALYNIPISRWDAFLDRVRQLLAPGGILLIKEQDPTARVKHRWNRIQEWITSRVHLTLGEAFSYESPAEFERRLARHGLSARHQRIDRGYPHAHILYLAALNE